MAVFCRGHSSSSFIATGMAPCASCTDLIRALCSIPGHMLLYSHARISILHMCATGISTVKLPVSSLQRPEADN